MRRHWKPVVSLLVALCLLAGTMTGALAVDRERVADGAAEWLLEKVPVDPQDTELDNAADWTAIVLSRGGYEGYADYPTYLDGAVKANFAQMYLSDYARAALAAGASGGDARNVGGHDLIEAIAKTDFTQELYTDGVSYALLAADSMDYDFPADSRQAMIDALCKAQRADGGFNYLLSVNPDDIYSVDGSVDTTGPVLAALAPYQADKEVAVVIEKALSFLKASQNPETAGFGFMGSDSAETISMAVIGLTALKIDPCGPDFVKNGKTMIDALLTFVNPDGGMKTWDGNSNIITTYQALSALEAYARFAKGEAAFYDFSDLVPAPDTTASATDAPASDPAAPQTSQSTDKPDTAASSVQAERTTAPDAENPATGSSMAAAGAAVLALLSSCALVVSKKRTDDHA
uniref:prenyltransferase/squalene oxidase repeat-containing protein n=1 Tax=Candidatus Fimivicinus sp. TaxID=3056640 RepID=UPI003FEF75D8